MKQKRLCGERDTVREGRVRKHLGRCEQTAQPDDGAAVKNTVLYGNVKDSEKSLVLVSGLLPGYQRRESLAVNPEIL